MKKYVIKSDNLRIRVQQDVKINNTEHFQTIADMVGSRPMRKVAIIQLADYQSVPN